MIKEFGGDPSVIGNPCNRSSFYRDLGETFNHGANCQVITKALGTGPHALHLSLATPTQAVAHNAIVPPKSTTSSTGSIAVFQQRAAAPVFQFLGPMNEDELNDKYGGVVVAVEKIGDNIVVTTENGCSIGSAQ